VNERVNISPKGQISSLGARGEVKNGPQGDQMSELKNRPKCSPAHFASKLIQNIFRGKSTPKIWAASVLKKLPQIYNHPICMLGKNRPI
jgi:hypothetical protein